MSYEKEVVKTKIGPIFDEVGNISNDYIRKAIDENQEVTVASLKDFIKFFGENKWLKTPKVNLSFEGTVVAVWDDGDTRIRLDFIGRSQVKVIMIADRAVFPMQPYQDDYSISALLEFIEHRDSTKKIMSE